MQYVKNSSDEFNIPDRVNWPFKEMNIGDSITLNEIDGIRGQTYCHIYARTTKKKFKTKTIKGVGVVFIRIA